MGKKIEFEDMSLEDVRQINNTLLQDLVNVSRASEIGFLSAKGRDHIEGGWSRGGDHVKGGWTRSSKVFEMDEVAQAGGDIIK